MAELASFLSWTSAPDAAFWFALAERKLNEFQLDDSARTIRGYFLPGGEQVDQPARLCVGGFSFEKEGHAGLPRHAHVLPGTLVNCNTIEKFRAMDFSALAETAAGEIWASIADGRALADPSLLNRFLLVAFADLKKHHFHYWFSFPALRVGDLQSAAAPRPAASVFSESDLDAIAAAATKLQAADARQSVFVVTQSPIAVSPLSDLPAIAARAQPFTLGVVDPASGAHPGWPVRTAMILVAKHVAAGTSVPVLCLRHPARGSLVLTLVVPALPAAGPTDTVKGWEKNAKQVLAPRGINLSSSMDPKRLAENAVDLNLRLMKWRLLPGLDLARLSATRCLLIGSGTLGCNVARGLLGWGVRRITLVDNGKVSFSNPVRQSLFTFEDCLNGGRDKAIAAAERLVAIFPSVDAKGVVLTLPMPGHPVDDSALDESMATHTLLDALIADHDVVFLLTDSRESRWLPALLCAARDKLCLTAAVGFDTYVAMRHGLRGPDGKRVAGCYFCSDVVAPVNSIRDRTLDQQCTVSRPGVSLTVSAMAVELMAAAVSHPLGGCAPAADDGKGVLGAVPHQIRGSLNDFSTMLLSGHPFDRCTACSARILAAYAADPRALLAGAMNTPGYLEQVSGLQELQSAELDDMCMVDMSDDEDEDEDEEGDGDEAGAAEGSEGDD